MGLWAYGLMGLWAYGHVVCAVNERKEEVAIKVSSYDDNKKRRERHKESFKTETAILEKAAHENIVKLIEVLSTPYCDMVVLELLYISLDRYLFDPKIKGFSMPSIIHGIFNGISFLESVGIIYNDLKPKNIMLSRNGVAKLIDFGLAYQFKDESLPFKIGTKSWMAPEGFKKLSHDRKITREESLNMLLYSFGVVAWQCITGLRPFYFKRRYLTLDEIYLILYGQIKTVDQYARESYRCETSLPEMVNACCSNKPEKRPSLAEIKIAFDQNRFFNYSQSSENTSAKALGNESENPSPCRSPGSPA